MRGKFNWRLPLQPPRITADNWNELYEHGLGSLPEEMRHAMFRGDAELTDAYVDYRWTVSDRLIVRASKRIVEVLSRTYFDNIRVGDIYLPDGVDCIQIVAEKDDPILKENLIFLKNCDEVGLPPFLLVSGTTGDDQAVVLLKESDTVLSAEQTLDVKQPRQVDPNYISIIAAIGFLADSDEQGLIRHEVLAKDREKYEIAIKNRDGKLAAFLADRARRRHKNERLIDTFELEIGESEPPGLGSATPQGKTIRPHVRRGHWRIVRYGEGRRKIKKKWIPPVLVNADLL